jgi:BlaI family transcriptional regulator, penicillinase repressor
MVKDYFGDSALQFASFFTTNSNLSADELEDLKKLINQELKKKKK